MAGGTFIDVSTHHSHVGLALESLAGPGGVAALRQT
jgi:hypothetical protein